MSKSLMNEAIKQVVKEEVNEAHRKSKEEVREAMCTIFGELNHMGNEVYVGDAVIEAFLKHHRTLQQLLFKHVICRIIKAMADNHDAGREDLRNEASNSCASELQSIIEQHHFPFI